MAIRLWGQGPEELGPMYIHVNIWHVSIPEVLRGDL
jgi:hypothetical protein